MNITSYSSLLGTAEISQKKYFFDNNNISIEDSNINGSGDCDSNKKVERRRRKDSKTTLTSSSYRGRRNKRGTYKRKNKQEMATSSPSHDTLTSCTSSVTSSITTTTSSSSLAASPSPLSSTSPTPSSSSMTHPSPTTEGTVTNINNNIVSTNGSVKRKYSSDHDAFPDESSFTSQQSKHHHSSSPTPPSATRQHMSNNNSQLMSTVEGSSHPHHLLLPQQHLPAPQHLFPSDIPSQHPQHPPHLDHHHHHPPSHLSDQYSMYTNTSGHIMPPQGHPSSYHQIHQQSLPPHNMVPSQLPSQAQHTLPHQMAGNTSRSHLPICFGCRKPIAERFLLKAMDELWHEDCLKCSCCDCRLGEVGSTLFTRSNLILCKRDYLRLFGSTGICSACRKTIPAFEMVMRAKSNNYHLECFACQRCDHRFCVGDKFYLLDNRILCEYDYEEVMQSGGAFRGGGMNGNSQQSSTTSSMTPLTHQNGSSRSSTPGGILTNNNGSGGGGNTNSSNWCNSLEKLQRQTESLKTEVAN